MAQNCGKPMSSGGVMCTPNIVQMPSIDYSKVRNKPEINGVILTGDLTGKDLGLYDSTNPETFEFEQKVSSSEWRITHNLNKYPSCTIVDSAGSVVTGDITYLDKNNLVITFSAGFSGTCYLN